MLLSQILAQVRHVSLLFGSAIPTSLLIIYACFTSRLCNSIACTHVVGSTSRTMSRGTVQVQWRPAFVQCSNFHRVESPGYEHSRRNRHCAHKISTKATVIALA